MTTFVTPNGSEDVVIHTPVIDKMSVCVNVTDPEQRRDIRSAFRTSIADGVLLRAARRGRSQYRDAARFELRSYDGPEYYGNVIFQFDPVRPNVSYCRFELNPQKLGPDGIERFKVQLEGHLPYGYSQTLIQGHLTRLDIALDVCGISPDDIVASPKWTRKQEVRTGSSGKVETIYMGAPPGTQYVIYDKAAEMRHKGLTPRCDPLTRIELRLRPKKQLPFHSIRSMPNPLQRLEIMAPLTAEPPEDPHHLALLRDSIQLRGYRAAMLFLPEHWRTLYERALRGAPADWWLPEEIWAYWPLMIDELGLLEPFGCDDLDVIRAELDPARACGVSAPALPAGA